MSNNNEGFGISPQNPPPKISPHGSMLTTEVDYPALNKDIKQWGGKMKSQLLQKVSQFTYNGELLSSIVPSYTKRNLQIVRMGIALERHGVFLQKGVGNGYKFENGHAVKLTSGTGKRKENPWFNETLEANQQKLQDILILHAGDSIELNFRNILIL